VLDLVFEELLATFLKNSMENVIFILADLSGHFYIGRFFVYEAPTLSAPRFNETEPAGIFPLAEVIKTIIFA
jgi:hypothetical protein